MRTKEIQEKEIRANKVNVNCDIPNYFLRLELPEIKRVSAASEEIWQPCCMRADDLP